MGTLGNTFDAKVTKWGHARKVWREIRRQYPAGGTIVNVADWVGTGKVPAGRPVKLDMGANTITAYTDKQITDAAAAEGGVATLGINGYLQEDAPLKDANTVATGTVIYDGEIYEYMFEAAVAKALKGLASVPMIVWVK